MGRKSVWIVVFALLISGCEAPVTNRNSTGTTIVCFGDSLTAGFGADPGHDYPSWLRQKVRFPVINAGMVGNTSRDALARLEKDVLKHDPKLVILTLGGNDALQQIPISETLANMATIIDRIEAHGAIVVWATVKTGLISDPYTKDFGKLARQKRIVLIPDILKNIMFNPEYKSDQIHPNSDGYKLMAEIIYKRIKLLVE